MEYRPRRRLLDSPSAALRRVPLSHIEPLPLRTLGGDIRKFMSEISQQLKKAFVGSLGLVAIGVFCGATKLAAPAWIFVVMSVALFISACFNAWRGEHAKCLELEVENRALREPPTMIEMRGARLEFLFGDLIPETDDQEIRWVMALHLFATVAKNKPISLPLHKCDLEIRSDLRSENQTREAFTLMMGLSDPRNDSDAITISDTGNFVIMGLVKTFKNSIGTPPQFLTATLTIRDSAGGWFQDLTIAFERAEQDGHVFWHAWPDLPHEPVYKEDDYA